MSLSERNNVSSWLIISLLKKGSMSVALNVSEKHSPSNLNMPLDSQNRDAKENSCFCLDIKKKKE